jgi:hypothetical protein
MNTHTDLRWILFATVPVNGYPNADPVMPIARGIAWLYRRLADSFRKSPGRAAVRRQRVARS